jgi:hypothetical protein
MERLHPVVGQAAGDVGIGLVGVEAIAVPAGEPALRPDPDEAVAILGEGGGDGVGKPLIATVIVEDGGDQVGPARGGGIEAA